jgi:hypothetical protein
MRPALITNGIRAKRSLLQELADAGLVDVAFHVDTTQQRSGYDSEAALNAVRRNYIDQARGLPLSVLFNTTVHDANVQEVPQLVQFFVRHSDVVRLASFQLQAETGRGILGRRSEGLTIEALQRQIEMGAETHVSFDSLRVGHWRCSRYGMVFVINERAYDVLDDAVLVQQILQRMPHFHFDRRSRSQVIRTFAKGLLTCPPLWPRAVRWLARKAWQAKADLVGARGRVNKLSFVIHNFMDACRLEDDRIAACTFMATTAAGPVSMCLHNATRDAFILAPVRLPRQQDDRFWNPLFGTQTDHPRTDSINVVHHKSAKGRLKRALDDARMFVHSNRRSL